MGKVEGGDGSFPLLSLPFMKGEAQRSQICNKQIQEKKNPVLPFLYSSNLTNPASFQSRLFLGRGGCFIKRGAVLGEYLLCPLALINDFKMPFFASRRELSLIQGRWGEGAASASKPYSSARTSVFNHAKKETTKNSHTRNQV